MSIHREIQLRLLPQLVPQSRGSETTSTADENHHSRNARLRGHVDGCAHGLTAGHASHYLRESEARVRGTRDGCSK